VVVVGVSSGACSSLAHEAVNMTIAITAVPPATAATRRPNRAELMMKVLSIPTNTRAVKISPAPKLYPKLLISARL
jgi:hypothetical protein